MAPHHLSMLIEAAQGGDNQAVEDLLRLYQEDIYRTALFMVKNEEDAHDITQEVCIKLYNKLQQLQTIDAFDSWLRIITINECKMLFRKNSHPTVSIDIKDNGEELLGTYYEERIDDIPHERVDRIENDRILFDLIKGMPEKYSQVMILFFYAEMSYSEIASTLKISEGTVKSRLFTAKKKLKAAILGYEKKNGITLHTQDALGSVGRWLLRALSHTDAFTKGASQIAPAAMNTVSTHTATAVSTSVSNSLATKISIATASVSVAVCIGITAHVLNSNSVDISGADPVPSASESIPETAAPESSITPDTEASMSSGSSASENSVTVSADPSVVYVREEADPSVIYRDREVVREAEPSVVYVNAETVRRYDHYTDIISEDKKASFRIYSDSKEAFLTSFLFESDKLILPSYVEYEGEQYPVTGMKPYCFPSAFDDEHPEPERVSLRLPEKLESIPDQAFRAIRVASITGGNNVTRIGREAFCGSPLTELDMSKVFPNVVEIGERAFDSCPLKKLVLPYGIMSIEMTAFDYVDLEELTVVTDSLTVPVAKTVHLVIPGKEVDSQPLNSWRLPGWYEKGVAEIKELHIELQDKDAVFNDKRFSDGTCISSLCKLIDRTAAENLYLPEGMKTIRTKEFVITDYDYENNPDFYGKIKNLYIPSTVTTIEKNAFSTPHHLIQNVFLPKSGKTAAELTRLKKQIMKSSSFRFIREDKDNLVFSDPKAKYPDGKYHITWGNESDHADLTEAPDEEPIEEIYDEPEEIFEDPEEVVEEPEEIFDEPEEVFYVPEERPDS